MSALTAMASQTKPARTEPPMLQKPPRQPHQRGHEAPPQKEFLGDAAVEHTSNEWNGEPLLQLRKGGG